MTIETRKFAIPRGTDHDIVVTLLDADDAPLDLTGAELFYRVSRLSGSPALLEIDSADMLIDENVVTIPITHTQSASLPPSIYRHELYMILEGVRSVLMDGSVRTWDTQVAGHVEDES